MRHIIRASFIMAVLIAGTSSAMACSCADPGVREKFREADVVFVGQLIEKHYNTEDYYINSTQFKIEKHWKGVARGAVTVLFGFDQPGWCGDLPLIVGGKYLVYAYHRQEGLVTNIDCGPNRTVESATVEIKKLDSFRFRMFARFYPFPKF